MSLDKKLTLILLATILLAPLVSSYEEKIILIRPVTKYLAGGSSYPEFINNENLFYLTCIERNLPIRTSVICLDNNNFADLKPYEWTESGQDAFCYLSGYDLEKMPCKNMLIQSEYVYDNETIKVEKRIKLNKFTQMLESILKTQFSDGGWKDAKSTAYGIFALSAFRDIFIDEISLAYEWLKEYRDDDQKCWPLELCNIHTTVRVLAMLKESGINDTARVTFDGGSWLVSKHVEYASGKPWQLSIYSQYNTTLVLVAYGQEQIEGNYSMAARTYKNYSFDALPNTALDVISTENIRLNLTNSKGVLMMSYQGDNFSYTTPPACWPANILGEDCDIFTTELALMSHLPDEDRESAIEWLDTKIVETDTIGNYIGEEGKIIETVQYVYSANITDENIRKWLLLKQNNNGSWGRENVTNMLNLTAQATLALLNSGYTRSDEPIVDAENWLSDYESNADMNDTVSKALIFRALKAYARPFIKLKPLIIMPSTTTMEIELFNPTPFNFKDLKFSFTNDLDKYLKIEEKEILSAYSYRKITLSLIKTPETSVYGKLIIKSLGEEVASVPILISHFSSLELTFPQNTEVFGTSKTISVTAKKSPEPFDCEIFWDSSEISSKSTKFRIEADTFEMALLFNAPATKEITYTATLICSTAENKMTIPIELKLKRYASKPFSISPKDIFVNGSGVTPQFVISNLLDTAIDVTIGFQKSEEKFTLSETSATIGPNADVTITINNDLVDEEEYTSSNIIEIKTTGQEESISFAASQEGVAPGQVNPMILYISIGIIVLILGVGGFFAYKYKDKLLVMLGIKKKGAVAVTSGAEKTKQKIKKLEDIGHNMALVNLIRLLRFQGKSDEEIRNRLIEEKFTPEEVDKHMIEAS